MTWRWPLSVGAVVPQGENPGAFAVRRKHHFHEGVDLHVPEGTPVLTVEEGVVVWMGLFTGPSLGHKWWLDTEAVMVEGPSGLVVYGEIVSNIFLRPGLSVPAGYCIGEVLHVLPEQKSPRPSMLHLELRKPGHTELFDWTLDKERPDWLLDPTPMLLEAQGELPRSPGI